MKKKKWMGLAIILICALFAGAIIPSTMNAAQKKSTQKKNTKKVLVVYFSATGTTKEAAKKVKKATGGTGTFTSNSGKVDTTSSCVFWLTGKNGYQEFISEKPTADPVRAYIKVKTENIGYGELTKTDESSGVKLSGAVYGIYSDSGCNNLVQTMTTDGNGYAKSAALVAGTYYVKEITAPKGYVLSGKVHTLTVKAGQTTGISATDKEQLGAITIYKEGEVLSSWNGSNFTYEKKKLQGATFKVTAGADIYKADGTKVYNAGDPALFWVKEVMIFRM